MKLDSLKISIQKCLLRYGINKTLSYQRYEYFQASKLISNLQHWFHLNQLWPWKTFYFSNVKNIFFMADVYIYSVKPKSKKWNKTTGYITMGYIRYVALHHPYLQHYISLPICNKGPRNKGGFQSLASFLPLSQTHSPPSFQLSRKKS